LERTLGIVLQDEFELIELSAFRRKYFNENDGIEFIKDHGIEGTLEKIGELSEKYLSLSAMACLVRYVCIVQVHLTWISSLLLIIYYICFNRI